MVFPQHFSQVAELHLAFADCYWWSVFEVIGSLQRLQFWSCVFFLLVVIALICYVVFLPWGCRTDVEVVLKEFKIDLGLRNIRKSSLKIIRVWKVSLVYFLFFYFKFEKKVPECTCLFIDFQNLKSVQAQIHFLPHRPGLNSLRYCIKSSLRISFLGLYNVLSQKAFLLR